MMTPVGLWGRLELWSTLRNCRSRTGHEAKITSIAVVSQLMRELHHKTAFSQELI